MSLSVAAAAASSSSQAPPTHRYDVFISFRGEDTRKGFLSHLQAALRQNQIQTFRDDDGMDKGGVIWDELLHAIRNSNLFVVIFSENYASSRWCLKELVEIMKRKNNNKVVIPVFYGIEPTHVRKQSGSYRRAFDKHERSPEDRCHVQQWRTALTHAANLSGITFDYHRDDEAKLISDIVKAILPHCLKKCFIDGLNRPFICNKNYIRVESLMRRRKMEKILVIGIWGMGGIGKSTVAEALFNNYSSEYEGSCLLSNSRELGKPCLSDICSRLLSQLLNQDLHNTNIGVLDSHTKSKLKKKRALIVLDDVVDSPIATDLVPGLRTCLCSGSIVILTTRDRSVLTSGGVEQIHEIKQMSNGDSYKLFSYYAFSDPHPKKGYGELIVRVIDYAKGIPLALKILGSFLRGKNVGEWDSALKKLRKYPNADIQKVLRLSYDALDDDEKNILLDVACFFHGYEMEKITRILNSCDFFADIGIRSLLDKSLISIYSNGNYKYIQMHSLIREMCWKIIHEESSRNGGQQTRLSNTEEICNIFQDERDIHGVESMIVDMNEITIDPRIIIIALRKMPKLRLLALRGNINMDLESNSALEDFQLPNDLRYIEWNKCPLKFVPSICWPQKLVQLFMQGSNIEKLWDTTQNLPNLEIIDLSGCKHLIECPNLAGARNLKQVRLIDCVSLPDVHPSIFSLPKIEELSVENCIALKKLCSDYCSPSLHLLWATGCSNLEEFSIPMVGDQSNIELYLPATALSEVPSTIMHLKNLDWFGFNISYSLQKLPINLAPRIALTDPIKHEDDTCIILSRILSTPAFLSLKALTFCECQSLSKLPDNIHVLQSLEALHVESCHLITSLPKNIKNLQQLTELWIADCEVLQYVPLLPPSIEYFVAVNCKSLEIVSSLTSKPPRKHQTWLGFYNCTKLDDDAYEAVLKDLKSRIQLVASDGYPNNEAKNDNRIFFYYLPSKQSIINDWFLDYYSREASIIIGLAPDHKISSLCCGCMLISQYQSCKLGEKQVIFGWQCYLGKGCNEWEWIATSRNRGLLTFYIPVNRIPLEMVSDHKVIWYDGAYSNKIMEAIKERKRDTACNPILKFEFYAQTEDNEEVVIKECGICWMHVDVNDEGEVSPDAIDEGYESDDLELEDVEKTGERVDVYCCALDIVNWFQRLLWGWGRSETEEEI
ncbi:disease resistance protein RPV1-like isoform X2 [Arachis stenosperma]|uniref:disease resistance protein RPV1-like isoform X2 n=1 Tax=Arachis stenosperma TaxID=217475 RepID=UPI0025AC0154|nr:disease resistance protein RPV1-like isoform X2 [Arachis stenosperma]